MIKKIHYLVLFSFLLISCKKNDDPSPPKSDFKIGRNIFKTDVDSVTREYYVHVPSIYNKANPTPMVFMLHGTSGDGEKFYEGSGWKEVGEKENLITVFPSSGRYCIIDHDNITKTTTKWNSLPAEFRFCANEKPLDDLKFLRTIIDELNAKLNIDNKRIYLVGFSNGGQMAAKCAVQLGDKLAAVVQSAGTFSFDTVFIPKRKISILFQRGNEDYGPGNVGPAIPMDTLAFLLNTPNLPPAFDNFYISKRTHQKTFGFSDSFTISGDTSTAKIATFTDKDNNPNIIFNIAMIKGLAHAYPNGNNHPMKSAEVNWQWLKNFKIP